MARSIASSVAPAVEQFELDGDVVVTVDRLAHVLRHAGKADAPRDVAYELQRAGWLGSLRTRDAWEFLPAARGGAFGSGDRFIEFRAQLANNTAWPGLLAMESAASVLGLAQRAPEREVVALPHGIVPPKALAGDWRVVTLALPEDGVTTVDGLPTWNLEGLLVGIATRPSAYQDIPGLGQWLADATYQADVEMIMCLLEPASAAARQRAAYLFVAGDNVQAAEQIAQTFPARGVAWFGPRRRGGEFDQLTQVNDTALYPYLEVGTGS